MEKITLWCSGKNFPATQKNMAFITKSTCSNKILQIRKNKSIFILLLQNKAISLHRNSTKQTLAVSHWPLAKQRNTNQKQNIKHNAQIKSAQPSNMTHKDKASDKTRSRRRIAAGSWTRGNKGKNRKWRLQRRGTATCPRTWKSHGIHVPVFTDGLIVEPTRIQRVWKPAAI